MYDTEPYSARARYLAQRSILTYVKHLLRESKRIAKEETPYLFGFPGSSQLPFVLDALRGVASRTSTGDWQLTVGDIGLKLTHDKEVQYVMEGKVVKMIPTAESVWFLASLLYTAMINNTQCEVMKHDGDFGSVRVTYFPSELIFNTLHGRATDRGCV